MGELPEETSETSRDQRLRFIALLHREKEIHKEHRHKHVINKMLLTGSFFGLGQFANHAQVFSLFLYVVPLIALVHDLYIIGEHFKVQRIGRFFREKADSLTDVICKEEREWEDWLEANSQRNRDRLAFYASLSYTIVISIWSGIVIIATDFAATNTLGFRIWIVSWIVGTGFVFGLAVYSKRKEHADPARIQRDADAATNSPRDG